MSAAPPRRLRANVHDLVSRLDACAIDAPTAMAQLRDTYTTPDSLRVHCSRVRGAYRGDLDAEGREVANLLRAACVDDGDRAQVDAYIAVYGRPGWRDRPARDALNALARARGHALLPARIRALHITADESRVCKRRARERLTQRHTRALCIDGPATIALAVRDLESADDLYDLTLALLLLTGRRTAEILNGRSRFDAVEGDADEHRARFIGQLKTRAAWCANEDGDAGFVIPLLAPRARIERGLERLRGLQALRRGDSDPVSLSNEEISASYQSALGKRLGDHEAYGRALGGCVGTHVHALRSAYAALVFHAFPWPPRWSPMAVAARVCGHRDAHDAMAYTSVVVDPLPRRLTLVPVVADASDDA